MVSRYADKDTLNIHLICFCGIWFLNLLFIIYVVKNIGLYNIILTRIFLLNLFDCADFY